MGRESQSKYWCSSDPVPGFDGKYLCGIGARVKSLIHICISYSS